MGAASRRRRGGGAGSPTATGRSPCCWPARRTSTTSSRRSSPTSSSGTSCTGGCSPRRRDVEPTPAACAAALGGAESDWERLFEALGATLADVRDALARPARPDARRQRGRLRADDAPLVAPGAARRSPSSASPTARSTSSPRTRTRWPTCSPASRARTRSEVVALDRRARGRRTCARSSSASASTGRAGRGRTSSTTPGATRSSRAATRSARRASRTSRATTALRVSAQVMPLERLQPELFDPRLGDVDARRARRRAEGVIVNIEYPLGLAAYNILREITTASDTLRGVYVLGKAATLNAAVGDVMISSVIHDEHSRLDVLARQRVRRRGHRAVPRVRLGPRQPARGHREVDVPAEPRVPRPLLPRGVHGRRDGGRARSATRSTRSPTSTATRPARR